MHNVYADNMQLTLDKLPWYNLSIHAGCANHEAYYVQTYTLMFYSHEPTPLATAWAAVTVLEADVAARIVQCITISHVARY